MKTNTTHTFVLTFLLVVTWIIVGYAQTSNYSIQWFTDSDGLPQNSVKDIVPDAYGYLWLSTENGLVRYDGQRFKIFNSTNIEGIRTSRMYFFSGAITQDSLLVFNEDKQAFLIQGRRAKHIKYDSLLYSNYRDFVNEKFKPSPLFLRQDGCTILRANAGAKFQICGKIITQYGHNGKAKYTYNYPHSDKIAFFTYKNKLFHFSKEQNALFEIHQGSIEQYRFEKTLDQPVKPYANIAGQLFAFSGKTLYLLSLSNGTIDMMPLVKDLDLAQDELYCTYYDELNQVAYVGTSTKGLCKISKKPFSTLRLHKSDHNQVEYALAELNDSTVLTASGGLVSKNKVLGRINPTKHQDINFLVKDSKDDMWTRYGKTLFRRHKINGYKTFDSLLFEHELRALYQNNDTLWTSTYGHKLGIGKLYNLNTAENKPKPEEFLVTTLKIGSMLKINDTLFLGTHSGLYTINPSVPNYKPQKINGVFGNVRSLYMENGHLWATTYDQGFYLYKNGTVTKFPLDRNKYLATSHCIVEDGNGYFWITTNKGLFQAKKQALYDYANGKTAQVYYHYYEKNAGFMTNEFNGGCYPCGVKLPDEQIYFPSLNGIVTFNANAVLARPQLYGVYLDQIQLDSIVQPYTSNLSIDRNVRRVSFVFSNPYYGLAYNNPVDVKLDGPSSQSWTRLSSNNTLSFTNLEHGDYTLTTRALSDFDSKYRYKTFSFKKQAVFWQTGWFNAFLILSTLLLIYMVMKLRIRFIENQNLYLEQKVEARTQQLKTTIKSLRETEADLNQQNDNQNKLLASISHDIKSPLKHLAFVSKHIYENPDDSDSKKSLEAIYTSSEQLYGFVTNLLDYTKTYGNTKSAKPTTVNLYDLVNKKALLFQGMAKSQKTEIENRIDKNATWVLNRQFLSIIVHNLLDNAVKHTHTGRIVFNFTLKDDTAILSVSDTGSGIEKETLTYYKNLKHNVDTERNKYDTISSLGLKMVVELLLMMNGDIGIESEKGKGTKVDLVFNG